MLLSQESRKHAEEQVNIMDKIRYRISVKGNHLLTESEEYTRNTTILVIAHWSTSREFEER